ncbi:MAG: sulfate ABC transporter substrate-binding protein, partial [Gemmataceae bacterium]|nr:sulfate ABC transporter substrate-binding protein [Gemmataceae bacterium]
RAFRAEWEAETGQRVAIRQSHGSSGGQARAVLDGLEADVVSLALWSDVDQLRRSGLLPPDWDRPPRRILPYYSTIVFVVRHGNPKRIRDWPDLVAPGVAVIVPNPKTSGNGRLVVWAAWGAILKQGGTEADAERFLSELFRRVPVLDTSSRASAMTFAQKNIGDVHLTWENEAHLEVAESGGRLEIVYPEWSIRAEPPVSIVDAVVDRRGTRSLAERYLQFLFTDRGQEIIARHYFRPIDDRFRDREQLPDVNLFEITYLARDWAEAQRRFFADGGVFDQVYNRR